MKLCYEELSQYKYQLTRDFSIHINLEAPDFAHELFEFSKGFLYIYTGYRWDGPSGPTFDTKENMRGALIHDVLYQSMRLGILDQSFRDDADRILRDLMLEDYQRDKSALQQKWGKLRSWYYWSAVRGFAKFAAKVKAEKPRKETCLGE